MRLRTLKEVADDLHYRGIDRERSVRRLFARMGIKILRPSRGIYLVTDLQFEQLIEAMTCLPCGSAEEIGTSVVRSVSGAKRESSKNILAAQIAATLQTPTGRSSKRTSGTKSFTVVEGGRKR